MLTYSGRVKGAVKDGEPVGVVGAGELHPLAPAGQLGPEGVRLALVHHLQVSSRTEIYVSIFNKRNER